MTVTLVKCSKPGWSEDFASLQDAVVELRKHICGDCLAGGEMDSPLDFVHEGRVYVCNDASELLSTSCGLEFSLEGDHGLWPTGDDFDWSYYCRARRKSTPQQLSST